MNGPPALKDRLQLLLLRDELLGYPENEKIEALAKLVEKNREYADQEFSALIPQVFPNLRLKLVQCDYVPASNSITTKDHLYGNIHGNGHQEVVLIRPPSGNRHYMWREV